MTEKKSSIDWNVEYPLIRESIQAFCWESAMNTLKALGIRQSDCPDDDDVTVSAMYCDVETMIDGIERIKYGIDTIDAVRKMYPAYNFWIQRGRIGANTRYYHAGTGMEGDIHVTYEYSGTEDAYFSIQLVCSDQIF